jgi:methylmalonyl-CoA/ethylmalonyl-CoA epimerase
MNSIMNLVIIFGKCNSMGIILMLLSFTLITCTPELRESYPEKGMIPDKKMLHIGIVVKDIETSLTNWIKFTGLERPEIIIAEGHEANPTQYRGNPSNAKAKLAFLSLENLQVELIEPIGDEPSHWKEFLDAHGESVHHIAFEVKGMEEQQYIVNYEKNGLPMVQHGGWDGGEYGYMDGLTSLGVTVELIERYK